MFTMATLSADGTSPIQPPAVKLRGSCQACAQSKLKCSQDKPTCARCAKRGTTCQYLVSKRAGRKQGSRTSSLKTLSKEYQPTSVEESDGQNGLLDASTHLMQYALQQDRSLDACREGFHHQRTPSYPESIPSLLSSAGPATSATTPLTFGHTEFDGFLASPVSLSFLDAPDVDYFSGAKVNFRDLDGIPEPSSFFSSSDPIPMLDDNIIESPFVANSPGPQTNLPCSPPLPEISTLGDPPQCFCFARSLSLLRELFPHPSLNCRATSTDKSCFSPPTIQQVIAQNEQTIQDINRILQCPCSQDGYTLTILALTVFKILAWYSAIALDSPIPGDSQSFTEQVDRAPAIIRGYHLEGEDRDRMAAQLVLSELHPVQRLVNTLYQRLKDKVSQGRLLTGPNIIPVGANGHESSVPLHFLDKLAVDLGTRLRGLSSEIFEQLRRGW
ncbi:hypothetical protein ASPVEDRAFT_219633 [Aspergillus versicolor CBS 583.65]|uniref:Zn(2)-C6 fungal-type domain-containing protein n=1 Tax=Aspergillus versicolor CBS 583.65 TaxID=1036611 RepID=A0A1L9P3L6_ASPVE|nr:uncharacterized protein ASPVEDRAFT_219633 [Aspergillus versicolor CBS 583.65]OJI96120.1 hypothetical protein ASPVEDRAFT_219633 [Aspergillus versicolor CBS 583.65]